ncbi:MAG: hypothetical protein IJU52_06600 [Clostridia bacterium]|nr:hypothetical protein [Clostridia bacterium]
MSDNDTIYYDTHMDDGGGNGSPGTSRILSVVLKTAGGVLIAAILFILIFRMIEMREPSGVGELIFTEKTFAAYDAAPEASVRAPYNDPNLYAYERESLCEVTVTKKGQTKEDYEKLVLPAKDYYESRGNTVYEAGTGAYETNENGKKNVVRVTGYYEVKDSPVEGAMRANHVYILPFARQVQLTFRYKSDALDRLGGQKNELGEEFGYVLFDDCGRSYGDHLTRTARRGVYRYVTMVFGDVTLDDVGRLTLGVRYLDAAGKTAEIDVVVYDGQIPLPLLISDASLPDAPAST